MSKLILRKRLNSQNGFFFYQVAMQSTDLEPGKTFWKEGNFKIRSAEMPGFYTGSNGAYLYVRGNKKSMWSRWFRVPQTWVGALEKLVLHFNQQFTNNTLSMDDVIWPTPKAEKTWPKESPWEFT
jgi:hypothetical protein